MPPPRFVDDYLLALLARASHAVSAEFHARLKAQGVAVPVWHVLASLSGNRRMTVGQLAEACLMQQPTMTKLLDRMEADGLVQRGPDARDARLVRLRLTAKGGAVATVLLGQARLHEAELLLHHSARDEAAIKRLLRGLIARHARPG